MKLNVETTTSSLFLHALNWIVQQDTKFRQARKLRDMPQERLEDMGLTREDAKHAFYHRGVTRPADRERFVLKGGW